MEKVTCKNCDTVNPVTSKYCSGCGYELPKIKTETEPENLIEQSPQKHSGSRDKRKRIWGIAVGIFFFAISYFSVQQIFFKVPSLDKVLMSTASEMNKTCPVMIDSLTRLDNTIGLPGKVLQYNYTLVTIDRSNGDTTRIKAFIEPRILNTIKTSLQMKYLREHETTFNYYYRDKNGMYYFSLSITPDKYK